MLGAFPRKQGMERKDLLEKNAGIFKEQGKALSDYAKPTVKVPPTPPNTPPLTSAGPRRRQPRQHKLPPRASVRDGAAAGELQLPDAARPQPRAVAGCDEGGGACGGRAQRLHLGQPLVDAVRGGGGGNMWVDVCGGVFGESLTPPPRRKVPRRQPRVCQSRGG
jgi:hypothetical protein